MGLFAVDQWRCQSQLYFLTHMHADHTNGLSSSWCRGPIYCSVVTAALLLTKFQGLDDTLVHTLEVGVTALVTVPQQQTEAKLLEVTPILANHCPGAVMYLFRGEFGSILHTGDFRWDQDDKGSSKGKKQLLAALKGVSVDRLYLDNTFCHPRFNFPPRHVAMQQVLQIIADYPLHDVIVGVDSLGKEELLLKIGQAFNTKVWVWPERLQTMRLLGLPDIFTTDSTATRIRAVPRPACWNASIQFAEPISHVESCKVPSPLTQQTPREQVLPSSVQDDPSKRNGRTSKQCQCSVSPGVGVGGIHIVNYSLHCSFSELESFIDTVKPRMVLGTVPCSGTLETDPSRHFRCLLKEDRAGYVQTSAVSGLKCLRLVQMTKTSMWNSSKNHTSPKAKRRPPTLFKLRQGIGSRLNTFCRPRKKRLDTQLVASYEEEPVENCSNSVVTRCQALPQPRQ